MSGQPRRLIEILFAPLLTPLVILMRYLWNEVNREQRRVSRAPSNAVEIVRERAVNRSADYIEKNLTRAMLFDRPENLWDLATAQALPIGICAEFGVYAGASINYLATIFEKQGRTIFGFDSFEGLRENWPGTGLGKGVFSRNGQPPKVRKNVTLVKGWFGETIPDFLSQNTEGFSFIHFDADTFEATREVLELLGNKIAQGTVLVFDEYIGFPNWENGEFLAWQRFVKKQNLAYEYLGFCTWQAAIRVL